MGNNCYICAKSVVAGEVLCFDCRKRLFPKDAGNLNKEKTIVSNAFSQHETGEKDLEIIFEDSMGYSDKKQLVNDIWTSMCYNDWSDPDGLKDADIFAFREGRYVLVVVRVVKHFRDISRAFKRIKRCLTHIARELPCSSYVVIEPHPDLATDEWKNMFKLVGIEKFTPPIKVLSAKNFCEKVEKDTL